MNGGIKEERRAEQEVERGVWREGCGERAG